MTIAFDLDEVLSDTLSALITFHNQTYGTSLTREQFNTYNWHDVWGGTKDEAVAKFFQFAKSEHFRNVQPVKHAVEAVQKLHQNHELIVITSRQIELLDDTQNWINRYFPQMFRQVFVTNHPNWAITGKTTTKTEVCRSEKVSVMIEDSLDYAKECVSEETDVILLNYPWNVGATPAGITRVNSWAEIVEKMQ
jgi:uncharacterized HAD superfamily protein